MFDSSGFALIRFSAYLINYNISFSNFSVFDELSGNILSLTNKCYNYCSEDSVEGQLIKIGVSFHFSFIIIKL